MLNVCNILFLASLPLALSKSAILKSSVPYFASKISISLDLHVAQTKVVIFLSL